VDKIKLEGVQPYDGEYDLDVSYFTNRELHTIKRVAGVRAGEIEEAFAAIDTDLVVALAVIALNRAGVAPDENLIWDAPSGTIVFIADEPEDEAGEQSPPVQPISPSSSGQSGVKPTSDESSGDASSTTSESPPAAPSPTGHLGLVTGADSPQASSAS